MQISLRSHLIAGTAAVVGAGAIAINPVMGAQLSLPSINVPAVASVALAGFDSPLAQLFDTLNVGNQYLLNDTSSVTVAANWPYAGFGTTFGVPPTNYPLLPGALATNSLGGYSSVGVIRRSSMMRCRSFPSWGTTVWITSMSPVMRCSVLGRCSSRACGLPVGSS